MERCATNTRSDTPSRTGRGEWRAEYEAGRLGLQIAMNLVDSMKLSRSTSAHM